MRYAGHLGLRSPDAPLFRHCAGSSDPVDQIEFLADLGFAGIQDNFLKLRPIAEQERIGRALARHGLEMGTFANNPMGWNRPLWGSSDANARDELRHDLHATIDAARRVGGQRVSCVTGCDPSRPRDVQIAAMVENLKRFAGPVERAGITLCIEPVAAEWIAGLLVDRLADALAIVQDVASPAVRLLFDVAHIQMADGEVLAKLTASWDAIGAIQVADTPGRVDLGAGELDWLGILTAIRARGWQSLIEIEHLPLEDSAEGERRLIERLRTVDAAIRAQ